MKFSVFASVLTLLASLNLWAAPATTYVCVGNNSAANEAVGFDLTFSDWTPDSSYTNESITVTRIGWDKLDQPLIFQMKGATISNNCQVNQYGETYMHGGFNMIPTEDGNIAPYQVVFSNKCKTDKPFDVKAYCFLE